MIITETIVSRCTFYYFTQTPIPGGLDGTIIDSRIIPVTLYYGGYVGVWLVVVHDD